MTVMIQMLGEVEAFSIGSNNLKLEAALNTDCWFFVRPDSLSFIKENPDDMLAF